MTEMTKKNAKNTAVVVADAAAPLDLASFLDLAADAIADMGVEAAELAAKEQADADALAELAALAAANEARPLETFEGETGRWTQTDDGPVWTKIEAGLEPGQAGDADPATDGDTDLSDIEDPTHVPGELKTLKGNFTAEEKEGKRDEIISEFTDRKAFEAAQPGMSSKMLPNLEAVEKKMATIGAAGLFLAMDIDPSFINREVSTGSRFNVYAFQKVNDLIVALDGGFMQNAINRAIVQSLFNFRDAGIPFTGTAALCAASDKVKADRAITKHLVRHTVSANTASTQKSSTMVALKTLGIVTNSGARGQEVWTLTDTPQTRRLEEVVRGKIAA
jgi:hypothetical protein